MIIKCRSFFLTCSLFIDSQNETRTTLEEEERNFSVCIDNSCVLPTKIAVEKPTDNGQVDACIPSLNDLADVRCITPTLEETPRPAQRILANRSNLNTLSPAKTSSLLLGKAVGVPSKALHHLKPVSRPKVRISLGSALHDLKTSERYFRRHSFSEGLDVGTGKQKVNFFHKGRIVPRKSIGALRKQRIVFTLLGKLGPYLDRSSSHPPILLDSPVLTQKCFEDKETQTYPSSPVSIASVSTQVEPVEATALTRNLQIRHQYFRTTLLLPTVHRNRLDQMNSVKMSLCLLSRLSEPEFCRRVIVMMKKWKPRGRNLPFCEIPYG